MIDRRSYWRAFEAMARREARVIGGYSTLGSATSIVFLAVLPTMVGVPFGRTMARWTGAEDPFLWGLYSGAGAAAIAFAYLVFGFARWSGSDPLDRRRLERRNPEAAALVAVLAGPGDAPLPDAASLGARRRMAVDGRMHAWHVEWGGFPTGALALVLLLHEWPRRAFAGTAEAYATDQAARRTAGGALDHDWDLALPAELAQHFHWPFIRCEQRPIVERAVVNVRERLPGMPGLLAQAEAHRDVIVRFGRFPWRNAALGRATTAEEAEWLEAGGHALAVRRAGAGPDDPAMALPPR